MAKITVYEYTSGKWGYSVDDGPERNGAWPTKQAAMESAQAVVDARRRRATTAETYTYPADDATE